MSTYRTIQGDMWDSIAYSQLGSAAYTDKLMALNTEYRKYFIFPAGVVLTLPEKTTSVSSKLPPWKQAAG